MRNSRLLSRIMAVILAAVLALPAAAFAADDMGQETESTTGKIASEVEKLEPMIGFLENVVISENPSGTVEISWDKYDRARFYEVSCSAISRYAVRTEECSKTYSGLKHGAKYDFVIAAYDFMGRKIAQSAVSIETAAYRISFTESLYRTLRSKTINPVKRLDCNLTSMINEKNNGYAVVQGGCTDGTYAYYLMVSTATQKGRVLKVKLSNNQVAARSGILNTWHGNGMTYDSKRNKLVVIAREHRKQEITVIDANTLRITRQGNVKYNNYANAGSDSFNKTHQEQGLAAIAYVPKYDCYIVLQRVYHNLMIFDPDTFEAIGMVRTDITSLYPGTYQAMDADEKYVYLLLSPYNRNGKVQQYNVIVALDWNSENLLPVVNASKSKDPKYVAKPWYCNNNGSGKPDAAIRLNTPYEAENIYHTTDKLGREHFYLSEYYGHYKGKYYKRDNFVYDLGVI